MRTPRAYRRGRGTLARRGGVHVAEVWGARVDGGRSREEGTREEFDGGRRPIGLGRDADGHGL